MKQILQNLSNGETILADVPIPKPRENEYLIQTKKTLVSLGTERMLVNFGKANLLEKARSQPEKVTQVINKIQTEGLIQTIESVNSKLNQPLPLGYSNVGTIVEVNGSKFSVGDRVVSNGCHAEYVRVSENLMAKVPDNVSDESASFTVLGAIALQGIRLLKPSIGEVFVVFGLGLIGLLAVQILIANGCKVIGIDIDENKCKIAEEFGADILNLSKISDPVSHINHLTNNNMVDGVLITASSKSNDIIRQSANMTRKRGRIVLIGVIGLDIKRDDFYEKELSFQVSCSYGPGRYDPDYEQKGIDYPYPFVRWTEQRNFDAVLQLMANRQIKTENLISSEFSIDSAVKLYEDMNKSDSLGNLIDYKKNTATENLDDSVILKSEFVTSNSSENISFIGGGNYASRVLIPLFKKNKAKLITLSTSGGLSAYHHGTKNDFFKATTSIENVLNDESSSVVIATQHNQHSEQVISVLENKKNVFVEKPLAISLDEVKQIKKAYKSAERILMVGYNRRFSPLVRKAKKLLNTKKNAKTIVITVNSGYIPKQHWTQDPNVGGGRIIGEACHFIDLIRYLVGSSIKSFNAIKIGSESREETFEDKAIITLTFSDGSIGSINYFSNGHASFPKEKIDIFCGGSVLHLNNFRELKGYGWKNFSNTSLWKQNKGQNECVKAFLDSVFEGKPSPIPSEEIFEVAEVSIKISQLLRD